MGQDDVRFSQMTPASDESYNICVYIYIHISALPPVHLRGPQKVSLLLRISYTMKYMQSFWCHMQGLSSPSSSQRSVDFEFEG